MVLDVITRLKYEANTEVLDNAVSSIENEQNAINRLIAEISRLTAARQKSDQANVALQAKFDQAIEKRKKLIIEEISLAEKKIRTDEKLRKGLAQMGIAYANASDQIVKGSNSASLALIDVSRVVQDLPYGFIGIANNINPMLESFDRLKNETGGATSALKSMLGGLVGAGGLGLALSVVTSLLVTFGDKLFSSGNEAEKSSEKVKKESDAVDDLNRAITESIRLNAELDKSRANRNNQGEAQAKRDLEEAKARGGSLEEEYLAEERLRNTQIANINRLASAYDKLINKIDFIQKNLTRPAVIQESLLNFFSDEQINLPDIEAKIPFYAADMNNLQSLRSLAKDEKSKLEEEKKNLDSQAEQAASRLRNEARERFKKDQEESKKTQEEQYKAALEEIEAQVELEQANDEILNQVRASLVSAQEIFIERSRLSDITEAQYETAKKEYESSLKILGIAVKVAEAKYKIAEQQRKAQVAERFGDSRNALRYSSTAESLDFDRRSAAASIPREFFNPISITGTEFGGTNNDIERSRQQIEKTDNEQFKKEEERRKKLNKERIQSTEEMGKALIQLEQNVLSQRLALLDLEISIRTQRQSQVLELARRGNVELLQQETERLEKAQREREKTARAQIQLNALLQASNNAVALSEAIGAIVGAAAKGDPYTLAARVIAAVAALVGGIFSLKSAFQAGSTQGFAEGGYTGHGNKFEVAGTVHKGEFVFTKEQTAKYRPVFEAIHAGKHNPYLAYDNSKGFSDLKGAIEGISIHAENRMDQYGVTQMIKTSQKIERRKWS